MEPSGLLVMEPSRLSVMEPSKLSVMDSSRVSVFLVAPSPALVFSKIRGKLI